MSGLGARQRKTTASNGLSNGPDRANTDTKPTSIDDAIGPAKHGPAMQALRIISFGIYFFTSCFSIHSAQLLGLPLYFISKPWFDAYMDLTKQYFALLITTMTAWWSPTVIRVSGDKSMKGLLHQTGPEGMLEVAFEPRAVLMANHQLYTDWLYLWWVAYTNDPPVHGQIYIILKESLKYFPAIGPGMMLYGFIFMARKWAKDQVTMRHRLQKLNTPTTGPAGQKPRLEPMWLLIFPEGTNLSANTRKGSAKFSEKSGIPDLTHQLLPRSTGLQFCLQELRHTVEYLYDCTIAYEGIPAGAYGQDIFTLRSVYFQGRPPKSVNMHWRRFAIKDIPIDDVDAMSAWVLERWKEKEQLLEAFLRLGKFPADPEAVQIEGAPAEKEFKTPYINTQVMPRSSFEFLAMFVPVCAAGLVGRLAVQILDRLFGTNAVFGS